MWGLNLPVLKWLTGHFEPAVLAALRMTAGAVLLGCMLVRRRTLVRAGAQNWGRLVMAGVLMVFVYQLLVTEGIHRTSATNGALVTALHPLIAALTAWALLGESLPGRSLLGAGLGLAGVAAVILMHPSAQLHRATTGDLILLAGLATYCVGASIAQRALEELDPLVVSTVTQVVGAVLLVTHTLFTAWWTNESPKMPASVCAWAVLVASAVVSTGVSGLLWNRAVAAIGMSRASMWLYWVPIFGMAAAAAFLGEPLTGWHVLGLSLVLTGTHLAMHRAK